MKRKLKQLLSFVLAAVLLICLSPIHAKAEESGTIYKPILPENHIMVYAARAAAKPIAKHSLQFGKNVWFDVFWKNGSSWQSWGEWYCTYMSFFDFSNGSTGYCIEPNNYTTNIGSDRTTIDWNDVDVPWRKFGEFEEEKERGISLAIAYGAPNNGKTTDAAKYATALVIWDMACGYRNENGSLRMGETPPFAQAIRYSHPDIYTEYEALLARIARHSVIPSFAANYASTAPTHILTYDATTSTYKASLKDTNGVLESFNYQSSVSGLTFSKSGNTLNITATPAAAAKLTDGVTCRTRGNEIEVSPDSLLVWADASGADTQLMVTMKTATDPVPSYFKLKVALGSVEITKTAEDSNISGIGFTLTDGNGATKTGTTNASGKLTFSDLPAGMYTLTENSSSLYESQESRTVMVVSGETTQVSFHNTLQRGDLTVTKDAEDGLNEGVRFHLFGTADCGQTVNEYAETDATGKAYFTDILIGTYTLEEVDVPVHYVVPDSQTVEIKWNTVAEKSFTNNIIRGTIIGKKMDEDGFAICDATFGLFDLEETEFTEETALQVATSNEIGVFGFEDVPYGQYVIRELMPAPAFVLNETIYPATISEEGQVIEFTVENSFITGSVETTKVDAEYPENKPSGAVFAVYVDVDGNAEFDASIDMKVGELEEVDDGVYRMDGLRYNGYFLHEEVAPEGFLQDEGYYYFQIRSNGETVIVENEAGVGFINQPITGELVLAKTDAADGKALPGVGFRIKDESGTVVAEGCTDENGIVKFTLRYGKYTYEEIAPLEGYQPNTKEYPFEIREDGQVIQAAVTNTPIPVNPVTGDATQISLLLCCIVVSGIGMAVILLLRRKKTA